MGLKLINTFEKSTRKMMYAWKKHKTCFLQGIISHIDFIAAPRELQSGSWVIQSHDGSKYPEISTSDHRPVAGETTLPPKAAPTIYFKHNNDKGGEPHDENTYREKFGNILDGHNKNEYFQNGQTGRAAMTTNSKKI